MNSKFAAKAKAGGGRTLRAAIVALGGAIALTAMTGCYSPRATDTLAGAALGAGAGALLGGSEGSPGTGALIGGLGGGAVGYIVGTETEHYYGYQGNGGYGPYGGYGYYPGGL
jgi:hypothetical protein